MPGETAAGRAEAGQPGERGEAGEAEWGVRGGVGLRVRREEELPLGPLVVRALKHVELADHVLHGRDGERQRVTPFRFH